MELRQIKIATAEHFGIEVSDLVGPSRQRVFSHPRQVAMYVARKRTAKSLPDIGRAFGNRDHTTVMHAQRSILDRMDEDTRFAINRIVEAVPSIRERELGGVFRSVRGQRAEFRSIRSKVEE